MLKAALERDRQARQFEQTIRQFGDALLAEPGMLEKLERTPDRESFIDQYLALASERGFGFSRDELLIAIQEQKQGPNWVIPRAVLRLIAERF